jgi:hypothetical protein
VQSKWEARDNKHDKRVKPKRAEAVYREELTKKAMLKKLVRTQRDEREFKEGYQLFSEEV